MQAFSLDQGSAIPVKLQLKAHVKYQIVAGLLRPGDQLPPLRDLAAGLSIHLNTVVRALDELAAEGYVHSHQGKGVFVADEFPGQGQGAALRSLLAGVLQSARDWGMTPEEMALALMAHGGLARQPEAAPHRLLLVGGARPQLRRLQSQLEATLPAVVVPMLTDEVELRTRGTAYANVACTLFHAAEVRRLLPQAAVTVLAEPGAREALAAVERLPAGSVVAVAARDWIHAARVRRSLELGGLGALQLEVAAGQNAAALAPVLCRARAVLTTADCADLAQEALGGRPGVALVTEPASVPPEVLALVKRAVGAPAAEPKVHVRSAWV